MLEVNDIYAAYDSVQILRGVSLRVRKGEIVSLIGPNSAGKTTVLRVISGLLPPISGTIKFLGRGIKKESPHHIVKRGISHVSGGHRVFPYMTVLENLRLGYSSGSSYRKINELASPRRKIFSWISSRHQVKREWEERLERVYRLFPILQQLEKHFATTLSGGEQQMLSMARGLMSTPKLLLLDEPSLGLAPMLVKEVFKIIRNINREGVTILLVEQNVQEALHVANRAYVLENGRIALEGRCDDLLYNDYVKEVYLGL